MKQQQEQQIHAVAIPLAAQGHINPLMRFCKALASHNPGLIITFVNIDPVHHRIHTHDPAAADADAGAGAGAPLDASSPPSPPRHQAAASEDQPQQAQQHEALVHQLDNNIRHAHIPVEGLDLSNDYRLSFELMFEALDRHMGPPLERLLHQLNRDGPPVTCLISDIGIIGPTQRLADRFHIPRIVLHPSSANVLLLAQHIVQGDGHVSIKVEEALKSREVRQEVFCDGLMGLPTIYNTELLHFKHVMDENAYMWKHHMRGVVQESMSKAHAVVVNSCEELEGPALRALSEMSKSPVYGVGPLLQDCNTSLWKEDEACMLWLDEQPERSVLYISFGSLTLISQTQFQEIVAGLVACEQRFLWVFRPDLIENSSYGTFPADLLSLTHGKGCAAAWAPQVRVLSHASVAGFLTHCGWNSVMEGISHGVPMLCWPYFADQFLNAKFVVDEWKIGLRFNPAAGGSDDHHINNIVTRDEVGRVIRSLMQYNACHPGPAEALRNNVLQLKEACHQSLLPGEGKSHQHLETLIQSLIGLT